MQPSNDDIRAMLAGATKGPMVVVEKDTQIGKCYWVKAERYADIKHGGAILYDDHTSLNPHGVGEQKANATLYAAAPDLAAIALSRGEALAKAEAENARLRDALLNERVDTLWNAYHCGIERDGKWMDAAMSDAEWLRRECGIEEEGWIDAEDIKQRIPGAAAKWVRSLGDADA